MARQELGVRNQPTMMTTVLQNQSMNLKICESKTKHQLPERKLNKKCSINLTKFKARAIKSVNIKYQPQNCQEIKL